MDRCFTRAAVALAVMLCLLLLLVVACGRGPATGEAPAQGATATGATAEPPTGQPGQPATGRQPAAQPPAGPGAAGAPPPGQVQGALPEPISVGDSLVVARVNGQEIKGRELNRAYLSTWRQFMSNQVVLPKEQQQGVMSELLQAMIGAELLRQEAVRLRMQPTAEAIDEEYRKTQAQASSEEQFKQLLQGAGLTPETLREEITRNATRQAYIGKIISDHAKELSVSEAEMKAFYDANNKKGQPLWHREMVRCRQILRELPPSTTEQQKKAERAKIEEAYAKLKAGADFASVAREYSVDATAPKGGDLGFVPRGAPIHPRLEEVIFSLKPGQFSEIVETPIGYHIIKSEEHKPEGAVEFDMVKAGIADELMQQKRQKQIGAEVARLQSKAKIQILLAFPKAEQAPATAAPPGAPASGPAAGQPKG
jgi:parvulin-like peptidyl-prolyl isomerase